MRDYVARNRKGNDAAPEIPLPVNASVFVPVPASLPPSLPLSPSHSLCLSLGAGREGGMRKEAKPPKICITGIKTKDKSILFIYIKTIIQCW